MLAAITLFGSGRLGPTLTALLGLAGAIVGARAFATATRNGAPALDSYGSPALLLGIAALSLGALFLGAADSGPGTGDGVVGSAAAIVLGLVAIGLDRSAAKHGARTASGGGHVA